MDLEDPATNDRVAFLPFRNQNRVFPVGSLIGSEIRATLQCHTRSHGGSWQVFCEGCFVLLSFRTTAVDSRDTDLREPAVTITSGHRADVPHRAPDMRPT